MTEPQGVPKEALKKLEDTLTCRVCLDFYKEPKMLQCFHVFCEKCLVRLVVQDKQGQPSVRCPTCRRSILLPATGVSGLQSAFHIYDMVEIQKALKQNKEPPLQSFALAPTKESGKPMLQNKSACPIHKERDLEVFCETCEKIICLQCAVEQHNNHQFYMADEKHKCEIVRSLEPVEIQLGTINEALKRIQTYSERITDQRTAVEADIQNTFQCLHEELEARKAELIGQLNLMTQQKMKTLAAQRDEIEMIQTQMKSRVEFVRESLKTGSQGEVVNMKMTVIRQNEKLTADFKKEKLQPKEVADMRFIAPSLPIQDYGMFFLQQLSLERSYITQDIQAATVEQETVGTLYTVDKNGKSCAISTESVKCKLVSAVTNKENECNVLREETGRYMVSFTPTTTGRHHLHVIVEGEHIKGSPFPVIVINPKQSLPIKTINELNSPCGVAVNSRGEVIVAESNGHCISVFSPSRKKLGSFGSRGSKMEGSGTFQWPRGIAVDDDDNILVVDGGNHSIKQHASDGQFIKMVGTKGSDPLEFFYPVGVAIHPTNKKVYVADGSNHRIQILNPDLTFSSTFGSHGSTNGQFQYPWDVAFDSTGNVYVADNENHRIQVFTAEGIFLRKFGKYGQGNGELNHPSSITIDTDNIVYITEEANHRVSMFSSEGVFLTSFGREGSSPEEFSSPRGVVASKNGKIYISDMDNKRVWSTKIMYL